MNHNFPNGIKKEDMKNTKIIVLLIALMALGACSRVNQLGEQISNSTATKKEIVNVPRNIQFSTLESNIYKEVSAIVTLPNNTEILYGLEKKPTKLDALGNQFEQYWGAMETLSNDTKVVYVVADAANDYGALVKIFEIARKNKIDKIGLVVSVNDKFSAESVLEIYLPKEPKPTTEPIKPNPLTLVVSVEKDGKMTLNKNPETLGSLTARLKEIFYNREGNGVFKEGTNEVYKLVTVKSFRSLKYDEIAKVIDALKGAGASPIFLQIDDLSD